MLRTDSHQAPVIERAKRFATNAMACSDCGIPWENCRAFGSENGQRYDSQPWTTWRWYKIALWQPQQWPVETPGMWKSSTQMATFIGNMINMMIHQWIQGYTVFRQTHNWLGLPVCTLLGQSIDAICQGLLFIIGKVFPL